MDIKEFVDFIIGDLNDDIFNLLIAKISDGYIEFSFVKSEEITRNVMSEKIHDYFEKVEIKTGNDIELLLSKYMSNMKNLVGKKIARESRPKKGEAHIVPRARRYYDLALKIRYNKNITLEERVDFARIIYCLYMSEIQSEESFITEFDYAVDSLDLDKIMYSLKLEKNDGKFGKKNLFDISDKYSMDMCTLIFTILYYCYIRNNGIKGEY